MSDPNENAGLARALGRVPSGLFIVTVRTGKQAHSTRGVITVQC